MCQCVIYRGTCFLWGLSWPHKIQSRLQGWNQRRGPSKRALPAALIESGKNKRSPLNGDAPDDTSHVVVIFTTFPLDSVAFLARNHFDVRVLFCTSLFRVRLWINKSYLKLARWDCGGAQWWVCFNYCLWWNVARIGHDRFVTKINTGWHLRGNHCCFIFRYFKNFHVQREKLWYLKKYCEFQHFVIF